MTVNLPKLQLLAEAKAPQRSGKTADKPTTGTGELVKKAGNLFVYKRTRGGKEYYDFIEGEENQKIEGHSIVYTYAPATGNLTMGSGARWARQEILTASPAAQKAGKKPALPDDMEGALKVAVEHYKKYKPQ